LAVARDLPDAVATYEAFLVGYKELLIVPHQELFKELLAALIDADGQYLISNSALRDPCYPVAVCGTTGGCTQEPRTDV